jgi:hypothetical protein
LFNGDFWKGMRDQSVPESYSLGFQRYQERLNLFTICAAADAEQKHAGVT